MAERTAILSTIPAPLSSSTRVGIAHGRQRIAYLSPFSNPGNQYIDVQKKLLGDLGFVVRPFTLGLLRNPRHWRALLDRRNVILLHWLETRPFLQVQKNHSINFRGLIAWLCYCVVLLLARARSIYVIHNHHVHDAQGRAREWSARLTGWLCRIVNVRVVHDPCACARYNASYWPHPLYRPELPAPRARAATPRFGILGSVRPYKGIEGLLRVWPHATPLLIAGHADNEQRARLEALIGDRGLQECVTADLRLLNSTEFDTTLENIDVLILPHQPQSVLVSGAFFEAIGRVPVIIARESPFARWATTQLPGIRLFANDEQVPSLIADIRAQWPLFHEQNARARAQELFGWDTCRTTYAQVLGVD